MDPGDVVVVSCKNARMERPHKPHIYQLEMLGRTQCPGYPAAREDGHDDVKPTSFNQAVKGLRNTKPWPNPSNIILGEE